ncbi:MAG TPA: hypothetical protein VM553_07895 [Dongiaceae bacterium]|nr:hypothetical protein [Dongiaceae bacterium]
MSALLWLGLLIAVEVPAKTESFSADSLPNALSSPAQVSSSVSVQPASFSQATLSPATLSPAAPSPSAVEWSALLDATGVSEVLEQANGLIGQEVSNLEKTPLGFTPDELAALQMNFQFRLGSDRLKQDVMDRLQQQLPAEQALQLQNILQSPRVRFLQTLQQQLNDDAVRQAMRTYRVQVQESTPNADRMELLTTLDETLGQSALEADLKVELRKQLLVTVSQLKSQESIPETMLDDQLRHYRQDVEQQISKNALHAYLYLFKRTPSTQVQDLIQSFDQPAFDNFMSICQAALLDSFRSARAQLQQDMRLANH